MAHRTTLKPQVNMLALGLAMIITIRDANAQQAASGTVPIAVSTEVPMTPGIYGVDERGAAVELLPTLTSRTRLKGVFGMAFSFGIAHARALAYLAGPKANVRLPRGTTFRFRFDPAASSFGRDNHAPTIAPIATSPAEFALVRMDPSGTDRRFQYGRYSLTTAQNGPSAEQNVPFTIARNAAGLFEVTVQDPQPGEYVWIWLGDLGHATSPLRVYEFGIDP
ncbi:MAG: hypothetical protein IT230_02945 [Flavobacteriales bacterium]|nr:hypothetical protein [Flavobacteriales bacterium]